jgi:Na+:H+ antiporter, NhaA family
MQQRTGASSVVKMVLTPIQRFIALEAAGGILLLATTVIALAWANSPWAAMYDVIWRQYLTVGVPGFQISKPLILWINDGLMAIFFFVIGLEIKRELLSGSLASVQQAALPAAAAVGGAAVPAVIYTLLNGGGEGANGWGIPMATDIAFALGILALLGRRAPLAL